MAKAKKSQTALDAVNAVIEALESGAYLRSNKISRDVGGSWTETTLLDDLRAARTELGGADVVTVETTDGVTGEYVSGDTDG